jgi:hypothetical protein
VDPQGLRLNLLQELPFNLNLFNPSQNLVSPELLFNLRPHRVSPSLNLFNPSRSLASPEALFNLRPELHFHTPTLIGRTGRFPRKATIGKIRLFLPKAIGGRIKTFPASQTILIH